MKRLRNIPGAELKKINAYVTGDESITRAAANTANVISAASITPVLTACPSSALEVRFVGSIR